MQKTEYILEKIISFQNDYEAYDKFYGILNSDLLKTTNKKLFLEQLIIDIENHNEIIPNVKIVISEIINARINELS